MQLTRWQRSGVAKTDNWPGSPGMRAVLIAAPGWTAAKLS